MKSPPPVRGLLLSLALILGLFRLLPRVALGAVTLPQSHAEAAGVHVEQSHIFIVPARDRVQIAEYYLVGNSGTTDYEGTPAVDDAVATTIAFELPEEATGLSFDGPGLGERYVGEGRRFADTLPIPPGAAAVEIGFSYEMPLRDEIRLTRSLDVPVTSTVLLVSGEGIGLAGDGLTYTGDIETGMGAAASYVAGRLESGAVLLVELTSREVAGPTAPMTRVRERNTGIEILIGIAAVVIAGGVLYRLWRSSSVPPMPEPARAIITEIAALDAGYEEGRIAAELYREERATLVRKAREWVYHEE